MAEVTLLIDGEEVTFKSKKEMLIRVGGGILKDAEYPMTLRQLYYRFVALDLLENKQSQYQYLGEAMKEARLDNRIPWDAIEDRTRDTQGGDWSYIPPEERFEESLDHFKNTADRHHRPKWEGQVDYIEVWVEKEALASVFARECNRMNVVSFPCRGYPSITMLKEAAERHRNAWFDDRDPHIKYFGDYDPSGQDIERNIRETIQETFDVPVNVSRIALTRDQIDEHELPPQPAKQTDARYDQFIEKHGNMAVELDALPPDELRAHIRASIHMHFDKDYYEHEVLPKQNEERSELQDMIDGVLEEQ